MLFRVHLIHSQHARSARMLAVLHATRGALTLPSIGSGTRTAYPIIFARIIYRHFFWLVCCWFCVGFGRVRARAWSHVVLCVSFWLLRTPNPTARSHSRVKQIEFPPSRRFSAYWYAPMMLAGTGHGDVHHLCDETVHTKCGGHVWRPHGTRVANDIVIAVFDAMSAN